MVHEEVVSGTMENNERAVARKFFKNRIFEANGQAFEDLFTRIMSLAVPGFKPVKPHGNIGDRKNDGYVETTQVYYQVFAPEDLRKSHSEATSKLKNDFKELKQYWPTVREFYFVLNDKYKGPYPDAVQDINSLKKSYGLDNADFLLAKDLENMAFSELTDDALLELVNFPPNPALLPHLDFSVLNEVVSHILGMPSLPPEQDDLVVPDWDAKIEFNGLGPIASSYLNAAAFKVGYLEEFLQNQSDFATHELRDHMISLYKQAKRSETIDDSTGGDAIFSQMVELGAPIKEAPYQDAFLVVLAKYFEACDVFEAPENNHADAE